jgi:hypothetical protein
VSDQSHSHASEIGFQPSRAVAMYKAQVCTAQSFTRDRSAAREGNRYRSGGGCVTCL